MSTKVRIEHVFECSEQVFWDKLFFDEEYNRRLFLDCLKFTSHRELKREQRGDELFRVVEVVPKVGEVPSVLKKLVGEGIGYVEEGTFEPQRRRYKIHVIPNKLADKLSIEGELFTESLGDQKCKRVFVAEISARIFGVGGLLEKRIASDLSDSYEAGASFTSAFIEEKKLGAG